ncbi:DUF771 domain-containing protein [Paenibacillus sp. ACRRX]|uniref:DUF771 domain-containing protein n=1 Tax=Paenibacillus sp. ACRRX TaxID=2918206 RepID=UPI001EF48B93|nr:DUF771 domain-containing protein [Paenibacillus sp. ACRRX]MCG7410598.1 DUF771 domain-containing protein [Paenibacillus sp. ACRRX]
MSVPIVQVIVDEDYIQQVATEQIRRILKELEIGCWWDLKRLEAETCRKRVWLLDNILLNPVYKKEMSTITNLCDGGRWIIRGDLMSKFLKDNFHELNQSRKKKTG